MFIQPFFAMNNDFVVAFQRNPLELFLNQSRVTVTFWCYFEAMVDKDTRLQPIFSDCHRHFA